MKQILLSKTKPAILHLTWYFFLLFSKIVMNSSNKMLRIWKMHISFWSLLAKRFSHACSRIKTKLWNIAKQTALKWTKWATIVSVLYFVKMKLVFNVTTAYNSRTKQPTSAHMYSCFKCLLHTNFVYHRDRGQWNGNKQI